MKLVQYFDGHIVINILGLMIRIKKERKFNLAPLNEYGLYRGEPRECPIIVSLTSFPQRINIVTKTIHTLLSQTLKPDKVILWLADEQFSNKENSLPKELLDLKNNGLSIEWYKDIRSYKKILPSLKAYPDAIIITTDDDIYYANDTVETLYNSYKEFPNAIHAHRCDWLTLSDDNIIWDKTRELYKDKHKGEISFRNRLTGYGAVLYPPHCLYKDVCDEELIFNTIPTHDDIWLWAMAVLQGTKTRLVKGYSESIHYVENSQQYGLCKINKKGVGMSLDEAYSIITQRYPEIKMKLKQDK